MQIGCLDVQPTSGKLFHYHREKGTTPSHLSCNHGYKPPAKLVGHSSGNVEERQSQRMMHNKT